MLVPVCDDDEVVIAFRARKLSSSVSRPCIPACASRHISLRPKERIPTSARAVLACVPHVAGEVVVDTLAVRSRDVGAAPATIEDGDPGPGRLHVGAPTSDLALISWWMNFVG